MNLGQILLKKAQNQELAHFYIIETSAPSHLAHDVLMNFVHNLIRDYYQQIEGHKMSLENLVDHPDVFVLGNTQLDDDSSDKFFKVDEAETLARFFEFKPVQGKRKFAVITEGHRINTTVANKWLKLLEEPQGSSTIFLLNPRRIQLLPTIHSRAIHLRLASPSDQGNLSEWNEFIQSVKTMSLATFLAEYRDQDLQYWVNECIRWEAESLNHPESKDKLVKWLKTLQEMETFHQPTATKWTLFYSHLKEVVLPRLS